MKITMRDGIPPNIELRDMILEKDIELVIHIECGPNESVDTELEGYDAGYWLVLNEKEVVVKLLKSCLLIQERRRWPKASSPYALISEVK